jgi:hypothetical protein
MADNSKGGNGGLYFIVGALVVVVGLGAYAFHGGYIGGHGTTITTERTASPTPGGTTTTTTTEKTRH